MQPSSEHPHAPASWNTAGLYMPLNELPDDFDADERFVHVVGNDVFVAGEPVDDGWPRHFVGLVEGVGWWGVDVPADDDHPSSRVQLADATIDLRSLFSVVSAPEWLAAGRAAQIVQWSRTHRFCGRCATALVPSTGERGVHCPGCHLVAYPRVSPAMIVLVTRGAPGPDQEALLAQGVRFPLHTCIAGFVEPGEDLESAVVREVKEEVGIDVDDVRYVGSQPWPFPHSLMVGFRANYAGGDIVLAPDEIVDAKWYRKDNLPQLPPPIAIASRIIEAWRDSD
jgi:NAD+ diphosphatase